jgi:NAD(P)-dependent dehydrogenase (short-subunit alcohol dehydrogenase family)
MSKRLDGKVCVITGIGGSMGREAALTFAREGALTVGCDLHAEGAETTLKAVRAAGGSIVSMHPCDLTKPSDCKALVDLAVSTFGRIDVLFNNAAMAYFNWLEDINRRRCDRLKVGACVSSLVTIARRYAAYRQRIPCSDRTIPCKLLPNSLFGLVGNSVVSL